MEVIKRLPEYPLRIWTVIRVAFFNKIWQPYWSPSCMYRLIVTGIVSGDWSWPMLARWRHGDRCIWCLCAWMLLVLLQPPPLLLQQREQRWWLQKGCGLHDLSRGSSRHLFACCWGRTSKVEGPVLSFYTVKTEKNTNNIMFLTHHCSVMHCSVVLCTYVCVYGLYVCRNVCMNAFVNFGMHALYTRMLFV